MLNPRACEKTLPVSFSRADSTTLSGRTIKRRRVQQDGSETVAAMRATSKWGAFCAENPTKTKEDHKARREGECVAVSLTESCDHLIGSSNL